MTEEKIKQFKHLQFQQDKLQGEIDKLSDIQKCKPEDIFFRVYDKGWDKPSFIANVEDNDGFLMEAIDKLRTKKQKKLSDIQKQIEEL